MSFHHVVFFLLVSAFKKHVDLADSKPAANSTWKYVSCILGVQDKYAISDSWTRALSLAREAKLA